MNQFNQENISVKNTWKNKFTEEFQQVEKEISPLLEADKFLMERKRQYVRLFQSAYHDFRKNIAQENLVNNSSWDIMHQHVLWIDAWIKFTWDFVLQEKQVLIDLFIQSADIRITFLRKEIKSKKETKKKIAKMVSSDSAAEGYMDSGEIDYYKKYLNQLTEDIEKIKLESQSLDKILPLLKNNRYDDKEFEEDLLNGLVIFARGGYGREELSFNSDIDIGYCIHNTAISEISRHLLQEMIKRIEELIRDLDLDLASQYFELGEDLSRFAQTAMMHTIPSILEARTILGNNAILKSLKQEFYAIVPREKYIREFLAGREKLKPGALDQFLIKNGYGGLRHLHYSLWVVLFLLRENQGKTLHLLERVKKKGWINSQEQKNLELAVEFYFDLRNFLGLFDYYKEPLEKIGFGHLCQKSRVDKDYWDDNPCLAYLKLRKRFLTVDFLDRFRLQAIQNVSRESQKIAHASLDRTIKDNLGFVKVVKHLGKNEVIRFETTDNKEIHGLTKVFGTLDKILILFSSLASNGYKLNRELIHCFSKMIPSIYNMHLPKNLSKIRESIMKIFTGEYASIAVKMMFDISAPLTKEGQARTLLGFFIPEVNEMLLLLRNLNVHEHPLCIHSLKALDQVEKEIIQIQKKEPELWRYLGKKELFALKWSTLFHDIGKIDPYREHEGYGAQVATKILLRLGWEETDDTLDLVRLLVENHQSVVRFSRLSTYMDLGVLNFFSLAQRDPRKVVLLYLVNVADYKSVNQSFAQKTALLENLCDQSLQILSECNYPRSNQSLSDAVNNYFGKRKEDLRIAVLFELLLSQSSHKGLEKALIGPLRKFSPDECDKIIRDQSSLEDSLRFYSEGLLDHESLEKHASRIKQILIQSLSKETVKKLVKKESKNLDWLFASFPNRFLVASPPSVVSAQLLKFDGFEDQRVVFSYIKGGSGEHDKLLFHYYQGDNMQQKIAYALIQNGVNIQGGKINIIDYGNDKIGYAGFFQIICAAKRKELSSSGLKNMVINLELPELDFEQGSATLKQNIHIQHYLETVKGYKVVKTNRGYKRKKEIYHAIKVSLMDAPYCFFKIMRAFKEFDILPQQVTITTIGRQIADYFYVTPEEDALLQKEGFDDKLSLFLTSKLKW